MLRDGFEESLATIDKVVMRWAYARNFVITLREVLSIEALTAVRWISLSTPNSVTIMVDQDYRKLSQELLGLCGLQLVEPGNEEGYVPTDAVQTFRSPKRNDVEPGIAVYIIKATPKETATAVVLG